MGLLASIAALPARVSAAVKARRAPARPDLGGGAGFQWPQLFATSGVQDYATTIGDVGRVSVVATCVSYLQRQFFQGELKVGRRKPDGTYAEVKSPLLRLWERWNPTWSAKSLRDAALRDLILYGNAYLLPSGPP